MEDHIDAILGMQRHLIDIAKAVEKAGRPWTATASGLCRLRYPNGIARFIGIPQLAYVGEVYETAVQPCWRQCIFLFRGLQP